jgi:phosphatidate phosphatase APP1
MQMKQAQQDEQLAAKEAHELLRRGEQEAEAAAKGAYSEKPTDDTDSLRDFRTESPARSGVRDLSHSTSSSSLKSVDYIKPLQKRASWNHPDDMSPSEAAEAHARLMARLRHFLAIPMANTPISVFFYNEQISKQRTVYTNPSGHFSVSAALDFVPTHVRILASDKLSATEPVIITESQGVSVISDIDDTIKHSAISSGAREIFRNAFIRELGDLTIDGVREWYNNMAEMGVKFHYVSNSPWQLYPVISKYFALAGLPPGSFHLKQYSGMLQGIFEPVAERKKGTLDKIARDFPERKFILIGDSGEADLEVYTDFVLENPGRVVAVFIRDVTSSDGGGFFDPSINSMPGGRSTQSSQQGNGTSSSSLQASSEEDDPEYKAAIAASLREMEKEEQRKSKSLFPPLEEDHPAARPQLPPRKSDPEATSPPPVQNLIDLSSDDEPSLKPTIRRVQTDTPAQTVDHRVSISSVVSAKSVPAPPRKPIGLRSSSGDSSTQTLSSKAPPPPRPRKPSSNVSQSSPLSQRPSNAVARTTSAAPKPPIAPKPNLQSQQSYAGMARDKLYSVYNNLPATSSYMPSNAAETQDTASIKKAPPPPPPPRRGITAYPAAAAGYVGTKAQAAWQHAPPIPHHSTRPNASTTQPFSTAAGGQQLPHRTNTGSTLGANGYGEAGRVVDKREQLWRQRWARAEQVLREQGVVLRSWRVGSDAEGPAESVIKDAVEKEKREDRNR